MTLASLSLHRARFADRLQLAFESRDALLHAAAVHFQLGFTRPTRANAAALSRQVTPHPGQSGQEVLQLGELDLEPPLSTTRTLCENIQNELSAIEHFAREQILQITPLCRRKLVVKNH